jgi:hypothetical protein
MYQNKSYTCNMDVRCRVGWCTASTTTLKHHSGSTVPQISINPHHHKGAPICLSTTCQDAKTLILYIIWIWDAEWGGLQLQPWHSSIIWAPLYLNFPKISPHPAQMYRHKNAPIRPSTAYQGDQTLYIYDMDVRCRVGWFAASTMAVRHHSGYIVPQFSKNLPPPCTDVSA